MYKHILLVTDLNADSDLVAKRVHWLTTIQPTCQLTVLHIVEETMMGFGYEFIATSSLYDQMANERQQEARTYLAQLLARNELTAHDIQIKTAISGRQGIIAYCQNHTVDLVVIGRHKRKGLSAWLTGATADDILPNIDADLLVVPLAL